MAGQDEFFDVIAPDYVRLRGGDERSRSFAQAVGRRLAPGATLLDVGAGPGAIARHLNAAGLHTVALDLSLRMVQEAQRALPGLCVRATAEHLPFASGSFDGAFVVWVLQHVAKPVDVLSESARVVRQGGPIMVVTGSGDRHHDDDIRAIQHEVEEIVQDATPGPLNRDQIVATGRRAGLTVADIEQLTLTWNISPLEAARRLEQRRFASVWRASEPQRSAVESAASRLRCLPRPHEGRPRSATYSLIVFDNAANADLTD